MFTHNTTKLKSEYESIVKNRNENDVYLFGYGSLLWKVDGFEYDKLIYGYVEDYKRQFWLLSDDHRGTREKMGRVLTLVKHNNDESNKKTRVYGIAYRIKSNNMEQTFESLNFREKCGYSLKQIEFYPHDNTKSFKCVCYYANGENPYFSPNSDLKLLSKQIHETIGPSGTNKEYLYNVCDSLRVLAQCVRDEEILNSDKHLFELEDLVKQLDEANADSNDAI